jgi:hypothetical protein
LIRPTLIIALGGTGTSAVQNARKRLRLRYGKADFKEVRYLFVDTDVNNSAREEFNSQFYHLSVSQETVHALMNPDTAKARDLEMQDWMNQHLWGELTNQNFQTGVQGIRMYGRLAFLASSNLSALRDRILNELESLRSSIHERVERGANIRIMVVASAGGGTGSGTFLDMGYLLRLLIMQGNLGSLCKTEGIAAIAYGPSFPDNKRARNSLALMQEIDFFSQTFNIFKARYNSASLPPELGKAAPFDYTYLVSPILGDQLMGEDAKNAMRGLEQKIADYIFVRLIERGDNDGIGARLPDMTAQFGGRHEDQMGFPLRLLTFGVSVRQSPIGITTGAGYRKAVERFTDAWLKRPKAGERQLDESVLENDAQLNGRYRDDLNTLRQKLGLLKPDQYSSNGAATPRRSPQDDAIYKYLIQSEPVTLREALHAGIQTQNVERLFAKVSLEEKPEPHQDGYVSGIIEWNRDKFLRNDGKLPEISQLIYAAAFDRARGPRYALRLLNRIGQEIRQDRKLIEEILQQAIDRSPVPAMRANDLFEKHLIENKGIIFDTAIKRLLEDRHSVAARLNLLIDYVQAWRAQQLQHDKEEDEIMANPPPGTVGDLARIDQALERLLMEIKVDSLESIQGYITSAEFTGTLPTQQGATDYTVFKPVEEQIARAVDVESPNTAVDNVSVLEVMGEQSRGDWDKIAEELLLESRPLLKLNLDTLGYGDMLNTDVIHDSCFWFSLASAGGDLQLRNTYRDAVNKAKAGVIQFLRGQKVPTILHVEDHTDPYAQALLFVRASFPSRAITYYSQEEREPLMNPPQSPNMTTAYTQEGISTPPSPERQRKAASLVLVAEALRKGAHEEINGPTILLAYGKQGDHAYEYRPIGADQDEHFVYSHSYDRAVSELANGKNSRVLLHLETKLRSLAQGGAKGLILDLLSNHIMELKKRDQVGYYPPFDLENVPYKGAAMAIKRWMREQNLQTPNELHVWAVLDGDYWKCQQCKHVLSQRSEIPDDEGECRFCHYPIQINASN